MPSNNRLSTMKAPTNRPTTWTSTPPAHLSKGSQIRQEWGPQRLTEDPSYETWLKAGLVSTYKSQLRLIDGKHHTQTRSMWLALSAPTHSTSTERKIEYLVNGHLTARLSVMAEQVTFYTQLTESDDVRNHVWSGSLSWISLLVQHNNGVRCRLGIIRGSQLEDWFWQINE